MNEPRPAELLAVIVSACDANARGAHEEALRAWTSAREIGPGDPTCWLGSANTLLELNRDEEARALLREAGQDLLAAPELIGVRARVAERARDWRAAIPLWRAYEAAFPDQPHGPAGIGRCLTGAGQYSAADAVLSAAIGMFPNDVQIALDYASVASRCRAWDEARKRWDDLLTLAPEMAFAKGMRAEADREAGRHGRIDARMRSALDRFHSLGGSGTFGSFQGSFGSGPHDLLKWSIAPADALLAALRDGFSGLGEEANCALEADPASGQLWLVDHRFGFRFQTFASGAGSTGGEGFRRIRRRTRLLRDKLLAELRGATRIFVYQDAAISDERALEIHDALAALGPNMLLCIRLAAPDEPGAIRRLRPSLIVGEVSPGLPYPDDDPNPCRQDWIGLVNAALEAWGDRWAHDGQASEPRASSEPDGADRPGGAGMSEPETQAAFQAAMTAGHGAAVAGAHERSLPHWALARHLVPDDARGWVGALNSLMELRRDDDARRLLSGAGDTVFGSPDMVGVRARMAERAQDWAAAIPLWESYTEAYPHLPHGYAGVGRCLSGQRQHSAADAHLIGARRRFPSDLSVAMALAEVALRSGAWTEAGRRWRDVLALTPDNPFVLAMLSRCEQEIARQAGLDRWMLHVLDHCHSLGNDCEFGLFQRGFGSTQADLLKWAGTRPAVLLAVLKAGFSGLGDRESSQLRVDVASQELILFDTRYWITFHTYDYLPDAVRAETLHRARRRTRLLRDKLVSELRHASRIFVYQYASIPDDEAIAIHDAMRDYGPNVLLCVRTAASPARAGTVRRLRPDLMVGEISQLGKRPDDTWDIATGEWVGFVKAAWEAWGDRWPRPAEGSDTALVAPSDGARAPAETWRVSA